MAEPDHKKARERFIVQVVLEELGINPAFSEIAYGDVLAFAKSVAETLSHDQAHWPVRE